MKNTDESVLSKLRENLIFLIGKHESASKHKLSDVGLSKAIGKTNSYIGKVRNGHLNNMSLKAVFDLAKFFNVSIGVFLDGDVSKTTEECEYNTYPVFVCVVRSHIKSVANYKKGRSLRGVSKRTKHHVSYISEIVNGHNDISVKTLKLICDALDVSISTLISGRSEEQF